MNREPETTGLGIVVLSSSMQLLHINRRAMELLTRLEHTAQSVGTAPALTAPLSQPCQEIVETMQRCLAWKNWEQFHQVCTIGNSSYAIVLKGFGLPDRRGLPHSRIVMLLTPHIPLSVRGITRVKFSVGISEAPRLGADSPQASACDGEGIWEATPHRDDVVEVLLRPEALAFEDFHNGGYLPRVGDGCFFEGQGVAFRVVAHVVNDHFLPHASFHSA